MRLGSPAALRCGPALDPPDPDPGECPDCGATLETDSDGESAYTLKCRCTDDCKLNSRGWCTVHRAWCDGEPEMPADGCGP